MAVRTNFDFNLGNDLIEIIRQRFFIDHSNDAKTLINEEYTIISRFDDVTNLILYLPNFLPNLTVYDSDGEELPVMSNPYTNALIEAWIEDPNTTDEQAKTLTDLRSKIRDRAVFLVWIKIPPEKALMNNQVKVFTLEYSTPKEKRKTDDMTLRIFSPTSHRVFYIIRKPEDYDFSKQQIETKNESGKDVKLSWNKAKHLLHKTETFDALSITSNHRTDVPIVLRYAFRPKIHIISVPVVALIILTAASLYLLIQQECMNDIECVNTLSQNTLELLKIKFQIVGGIIAAALVLTRLINNPYIRHSMIIL